MEERFGYGQREEPIDRVCEKWLRYNDNLLYGDAQRLIHEVQRLRADNARLQHLVSQLLSFINDDVKEAAAKLQNGEGKK